MQPLKARVRKGRLILDEPTNLPEGDVVELFSRDEVLERGGDFLDDDARAALHRELEASILEADGGQTEDFSKVMAELRRRR
jgi:hypothetical protein